MKLELRALLVDKRANGVSVLTAALEPDITLEVLEIEHSLSGALQRIMEDEYNLFFFSDAFPLAEVKDFLNDIRKVTEVRSPVYIQIRDKLPGDFDRASLMSAGIHTVFSLESTQIDKDALWKCLRELQDKAERKERLIDVGRATELLITEIDRVAKDRKRGAKGSINKLTSEFILRQLNADEKIHETYLKQLIDQTAASEPFECTKVDIPNKILEKNLPHLEKDRYTGASSRVWEKLLNRHGVPVAKALEAAKNTDEKTGEKVHDEKVEDSNSNENE